MLRRALSNNILQWGIGGFLGGSLYQVAMVWLEGKTGQSSRLRYYTPTLRTDYEMYTLYKALAEHSDPLSDLFRVSITCAERFSHVYNELLTGTAQSTLGDRRVAYTFMTTSISKIEELLHVVKKERSPEHTIKFHNAYMSLFECFEARFLAIMKLTTEVCQ